MANALHIPRTVRGTFLLLLAVMLAMELVQVTVTSRSSMKLARESALDAGLELAGSASGTLRAYVADVVHEELEIGRRLLTAEGPAQSAAALADGAAEHPSVRYFAVLDPSGAVVEAGAPATPELAAGASATPWLRALAAGKPWAMGDLIVGPDGRASFVVATALRGADGRLRAVVAAIVDPVALESLFPVRRGKGSVALLDTRGQIALRVPHVPLTATQRDLVGHIPEIRRALGGEVVTGTFVSPVDGVTKLISVLPVPGTQWLALAAQVEQEALAPGQRAVSTDVLVGALSLLMGLGLAALLARRLTRPLGLLKRHAQELGEGRLEQRVQLDGPEELEALASAFNAMAEQLHDRERRLVDATERARVAADTADRDAAQLRLLIDALPEGVFVAEAPEGRVVLANKAAVTLMGRSIPEGTPVDARARELGLKKNRLAHYEPHELPISRALRGEPVVQQEVLIARPDGSELPVMVNCVPLLRGGEIHRAIAVFQDIAALKQLEQLRDDFVHLVSHDLRNPLNVVNIQVELLKRRVPPSDEGAQHAVKAIVTATRQMTTMLHDLLESARAESGALRLDLRPIDVPEMIRRHVETLGPERDRVQVETRGAVGLVPGDPNRLERVVSNLVSNALKYSKDEVRVEVEELGAELRVSVSDRGDGVPAEVVPRLFQRYHRAPGTERIAGVGLGLYIIRLLVEAHRGRVWAESTPGQGSTFAFSLPKQAEARPG